MGMHAAPVIPDIAAARAVVEAFTDCLVRLEALVASHGEAGAGEGGPSVADYVGSVLAGPLFDGIDRMTLEHDEIDAEIDPDTLRRLAPLERAARLALVNATGGEVELRHEPSGMVHHLASGGRYTVRTGQDFRLSDIDEIVIETGALSLRDATGGHFEIEDEA